MTETNVARREGARAALTTFSSSSLFEASNQRPSRYAQATVNNLQQIVGALDPGGNGDIVLKNP